MLKRIALVAALTTTWTTSAFAGTTDTLVLTGSIASAVNISVAAEPVASALDLAVTQSDLKVATATEDSNAAGGYLIKMKSANGSKLNHATLADFVAYTVKYNGGSAVTLTAVDQTVKTQNTGGSYVGVANDVTISYTGATGIAAGNYSDTITFTIVGQ